MELKDTPTGTLTTIFKQHVWANLRLLKVRAGLTAGQLATSMPAARGSIQETLEHIVRAEQSYFSRISTGKPLHRPDNPPMMTIAEMMDSVRQTGEGLIEWASTVRAEDVVEIDWNGEMRDVPKTIILAQAVAHAAEHREQIKTILTQLGIEPPNLQSWAYFDELDRSGKQA